MIDLLRRATTRAAARLAARLAPWTARHALNAALYGDYKPAQALIERLTPLGADALVPAATVWADTYLGDAPPPAPGDPYVPEINGPATPIDRWVGDLVAARANRDDLTVHALIAELPPSLIRAHMETLLWTAATARLALDDPDPVWP